MLHSVSVSQHAKGTSGSPTRSCQTLDEALKRAPAPRPARTVGLRCWTPLKEAEHRQEAREHIPFHI